MTGGFTRNKGSGLNVPNNARGSRVKNFLLSDSRRWSVSALQLSAFSPSTTRSDENVSLTAHRETAFDERVSAQTIFLANNIDESGRLRTSSLTMDVSCHKIKDMDSGNSSLIDSSSADSYQEFGSEGRSRTTSSSKSVQSLTSVNPNEYEMGSDRKRHSSNSDSSSSGKVSLNASDITKTSEESLASDKNKECSIHPSTYYIQEDAYLDSESQPFLYRPHLNSFRCSQSEGNYISDPDIQDNASIDEYEDEICEYPANEDSNVFNSTIININPDDVSYHVPTVVTNRRFKGNKRQCSKDSRKERDPLLGDYRNRSEIKESPILESSHECSQPPLRRTASLGNLSNLSQKCMDTSDTTDTLDPTSHFPSLALTSETRLTSSMRSFTFQRKRISDLQPHSFRLYPRTGLDNSQIAASRPTHLSLDTPHIHSSQPEYSTMGTPNPESQNIQAADTQGQMCSNYECLYTESPYNNQLVNWRGSMEAPKTAPVDAFGSYQPRQSDENSLVKNCMDTSLVQNSAIKNPVQNLESVLGHGSPVTISVLKQGFNLLKCEKEKPLQVFVPRSKAAAQATNKRHLANNMMPLSSPCQGETQLEDVTVCWHKIPEAEPIKSMKTTSHVESLVASATLVRDERSCQSYPSTMSQGSIVCSSPGVPEYNKNVSSFGDMSRKQIFQYMNNESASKDECMSMAKNVETQKNFTKPPALLESFCNTRATKEIYQRKMVQSCPSYYGGCESEPILKQTNKVSPEERQIQLNEDKSLKVHVRCTSQKRINLLPQMSFPRQCMHRSADSPDAQTMYPSRKATTNFAACENKFSDTNATDQLCRLYNSDETKLKTTNNEIMNNRTDTYHVHTDEHGHTSKMIIRVPKACFVPGFLESHDIVNSSKSSSLGHSVPSSLDSGHVENNDGSLQSSNPSQLGLLSPITKSQRECEYFNREVPDYKYLCFVAIIMNPLFGLVALICNHFAQRNLRQQRRTHANNLYFATIAISTVAIFLTLIAGALFIAHNIVLQSEKTQSSATNAGQSCEGRFFGYDDSLKKFFNVDFELYCEITKNERIMEALKRFWLEDSHIKKKHSKQKSNKSEEELHLIVTTDDSNSTDEGSDAVQIGDRDVYGETMLNNRTDADYNNVGAARMFKPSAKNITSNSSLARSVKDPIIPPGLEGEYERYLDGHQRTKVKDEDPSALLSVLSQDILSDSEFGNRSSESTTVSIVYEFEGNTTDDGAADPLVN